MGNEIFKELSNTNIQNASTEDLLTVLTGDYLGNSTLLLRKIKSGTNPEELINKKTINQNTAIKLLAIKELGKRIALVKGKEQQYLRTPLDLIKLVNPYFEGEKTESFLIIYLGIDNVILAIDKLTQNNANQLTIYTKEMYRQAILRKALGIGVAHNHPSGRVIPSDKDNLTTQSIAISCNALGISFFDHVIVGNTKFFSYFTAGILKQNGEICNIGKRGGFTKPWKYYSHGQITKEQVKKISEDLQKKKIASSKKE